MVAHYPTRHGTLAELDDTGDALASYLEITHTPPQGLACDFCPYQAKTRRDVDRHIISVHKKEQKYFCPEPRCRRHTVGWPRKDLRNRHLKSVHRNSTKKPGTDATTPPTLNGSPRSISTSPASSPGQPRDLLLDDVFEHGLQQLASGAPESIDKLKTQLTDKEKQLSEVKEQLSEMVKQLCETRKERDQAHEQLKVVTAQMEEQLRAVTAQMEEQRKTYEVRQEKFLSIVDQMDTKGAW